MTTIKLTGQEKRMYDVMGAVGNTIQAQSRSTANRRPSWKKLRKQNELLMPLRELYRRNIPKKKKPIYKQG